MSKRTLKLFGGPFDLRTISCEHKDVAYVGLDHLGGKAFYSIDGDKGTYTGGNPPEKYAPSMTEIEARKTFPDMVRLRKLLKEYQIAIISKEPTMTGSIMKSGTKKVNQYVIIHKGKPVRLGKDGPLFICEHPAIAVRVIEEISNGGGLEFEPLGIEGILTALSHDIIIADKNLSGETDERE